MDENEQQNEQAPDVAEKAVQAAVPYERFKEVNDKYRRLEKKVAELDLAKVAEETRLKEEQGKYKELLDDLKPKAGRAEVLQNVLNEVLDAEMENVPEAQRDLVPYPDEPEKRIAWLKSAQKTGLFAFRKAPDLDAGASGAGEQQRKKQAPLTPSQVEAARRLGMTEDEYREFQK